MFSFQNLRLETAAQRVISEDMKSENFCIIRIMSVISVFFSGNSKLDVV